MEGILRRDTPVRESPFAKDTIASEAEGGQSSLAPSAHACDIRTNDGYPFMILGAVLAGGKSSRFGSDKALAEFQGRTLLSGAVDALSGWCEHVIVVGRETAPAPTLPDWPHPGMGPLGGLAAALHHAADEGYETVLSCGVDSVGLPENLLALLQPAPACLAGQPVVGLWPATALPAVEAILTGEEKHSMHRLAEAIGARRIELAVNPANINTLADLDALERGGAR